VLILRKKRKNEKKRKNKQQQLNENNLMIQQQEKRETVVLESEMNTITSFDETNTNTATLSTYQPGVRSSQINKQTNIFFLHIFHIGMKTVLHSLIFREENLVKQSQQNNRHEYFEKEITNILPTPIVQSFQVLNGARFVWSYRQKRNHYQIFFKASEIERLSLVRYRIPGLIVRVLIITPFL
jgi:hypothetical protein